MCNSNKDLKFLKKDCRRINLEYVKEFDVNNEIDEDIFSIIVIDKDDKVKTIDVNIREMISSERVEIEENKKKEIIKRTKEECYYSFSVDNLFTDKEGFDIDNMVNDCLLSVLDMYK